MSPEALANEIALHGRELTELERTLLRWYFFWTSGSVTYVNNPYCVSDNRKDWSTKHYTSKEERLAATLAIAAQDAEAKVKAYLDQELEKRIFRNKDLSLFSRILEGDE